MTSIASVRRKLLILAAIGVAGFTVAGRAQAAVSCAGNWTDDRAAASPTITFPNNNATYAPGEILINPGQTVVWNGTSPSATFSNYPLVSTLWGTFSVNETSWPFTYTQPGSWEYHDGNDTTMEGIVCVAGPFVAAFTTIPASPKPNQTVTFDGSDSHEQFATLQDYKWDFGTGTFSDDAGSSAHATHVFSKAGVYTVRLSVTDDSGQSMIKSEKVTIGTVITQAAKLETTTVKQTSAGKVLLKIENPNGIKAQGRVNLTRGTAAGGAPIGSANFTVPAHGTVTVPVALSSQAKSYLAQHKSLPARATIVLSANNTSKSHAWTITIDR